LNASYIRGARAYRNLYLAETIRQNGKTRQRIIRKLSARNWSRPRGDLDRLAPSAARLAVAALDDSVV